MDILSKEALESETAFDIGSNIPGLILGVLAATVLLILGVLNESGKYKVAAVIVGPALYLIVTLLIHRFFKYDNKTTRSTEPTPFVENITKYCRKCRRDTEWFVGEDGTLLCNRCVSKYETELG